MISREPVTVRPRSAPRRALVVLAVVGAVLLLTLRQLATFWTDYLWFASIERTGVWSTLVITRVLLVVVFAIIAFGVLWVNLWVADRLSPRGGIIPQTPDEELVVRFQTWVEPRIGRVRLLVALGFGLLIGLAAGAWWEDWLLFSNSSVFGVADPQFNTDISFYVFRLPFYRDLFGWGFQLLIVTTLIVAGLHYLNGGIQVQNQFERVKPGVKAHLSVLVAVLAILKAVGYQLDKFDLLYSSAGQVFGASYTDVNARLPALNLLILISVFAGILLLVNIRFRGWTLPAVALGLWVVTSIIVGGIYPAAVQRFSVEPDELNKELPFVDRNIKATRQAYGLADTEVREFAASSELSAADIDVNRSTIDNLRLWDPSVLQTTYRQLQELRTYYKFEDVDVDRYELTGGLTQVMLAARELDQNNIPGGGWVNNHLVYTHGFGSVVSPANAVTTEGQPDFLVKDIPPDNLGGDPDLEITQPRLYFGEGFRPGSFVFVKTKEQELDFPLETGVETVRYTTYEGSGGVKMGDYLRRAAFALRFADFNTLISNQLTGDSRVLMERNINDRVTKLAPYLRPDGDPYIVVLEGRLTWVLDLYTWTNKYPYSQPATTARLNRNTSTLPNAFNYLRNSVKATIDAENGTMTLYVVDPDDPVIRTWRKVFPEVFTDGSEISDQLRSHLRYPEDMFRVQADMYNQYHVTDPRVFFTDGDPWAIARDPSTTDQGPLRNPAAYRDDQGPFKPMVPYYLLLTLPDEEDLSFLILQPFTPKNRPNMVSFLAAKSGPEEYGKIIDFQLPRDRQIDGPGQVGARINQDPTISSEFTLLGQQGSDVIQGNMLVVPIEESVLYVQPIYISASGTTSGPAGDAGAALPEFKRVVMVYENSVVMENSVDEALARIFGEGVTPRPPDPGTTPPTGDIDEQVEELLRQAAAAFQAANAALANQDLAGYAENVARAEELLDQALGLLAPTESAEDATATETSAGG